MQLESTYQQRGSCQAELSEVTVTTPKVLHFCPITACLEVFIAQYLLKNHMAYFFSPFIDTFSIAECLRKELFPLRSWSSI